jgi:hypothetical protein
MTSKRLSASLAVAIAVAAVGAFTSSALAHAYPVVPLLPPFACSAGGYQFPGGGVTLSYTEAGSYTIFSTPAGTRVDVPARTDYPNGTSMAGSVTGGITGGHVELTVTRAKYSAMQLVGDVAADNKAHGTFTYDNGTGSWQTNGELGCVAAPAAPAQVNVPPVNVPPPVEVPPPPVTNAIQASFGDPGLSTLDFNVTNTSALTATCNYTATANSLNPLVPKKTTRQFNVPANGNHTESFNGAPTLTSYDVTLSCKDVSGKQKDELGHVDTSVLW